MAAAAPSRPTLRAAYGPHAGAGFHRTGCYHFYLFDADAKVHSAASMQCHDDLDAIAPFEPRQSTWHPAIEAWHGLRLVERIGNRLPS